MSKKIEEWIEKYDSKVERKFTIDTRYKLLYNDEKGFCQIMKDGEMLIVKATCGDIKYWRGIIEECARQNGLKKIGTCCIRKIKPYIRLNGFEITKTEETAEGIKYYGEDKKTRQKGEAIPAEKLQNGERSYYVIWEVK